MRKYFTSGVVPASVEPIVDKESGSVVRNGGATWDSDKRAWRTTTWISKPERYRVTYDDGSSEILDKKPEEKPVEGEIIEETKERQVVSFETIPGYWELENKYINPDQVPEWEQYKVREVYYVEPQPQPSQIPLSRQGGPDRLIREAMRKQARAGQIR